MRTRTQNGRPLKDNEHKNPKEREHQDKRRKEANSIKGKQRWVGGSIAEGGHWERP